MARTWSAVLARLGVPTGDKRIIAPGALTNRDLPLPLMWQRVSDNGHSGAVTVGAIETLTIDNASGMVLATGRFLPVRGSAEAQAQADAGVTGPSVDLFDDIDIVEVQTLIEAGVVGPNITDDMDDVEYAMDDDGMVVITKARIAGATLVQIPAFAGVSISMVDGAEPAEPMDVMPGGRPDDDLIDSVYGNEHGDVFPWLYASASPEALPPLDWFRQPDLDRLTPITVSDTGRVFGHIAGWGTCHVALPGCVTPPHSDSAYIKFMTGEQPTAEGLTIPVGAIVAGPRHADPGLAFAAAAAHYDDPGAAAAKVMAGEDDYGIWVAGWINPDARPEAVRIFKSSPVSGDWRRTGGALDLAGVCSVNSPGFPVMRARVAFSLERQSTLIASTGMDVVEGEYVIQRHKDRADRMASAFSARARWAWEMAQGTGV